MLKRLILSALLLVSISSFSQLLIPLFEIPQKVEELSDDAEEQTPVTFNQGEGMFFNRFYEKVNEDGGVIKAQDIWYSSHGKKGWDSPFRAFRDVDGREIKILIGCTRDGERLYLLNRYFEGDSIKHRIVYKTRKGKSTWKDPVEVVIPGIDLSDQQTTLFMHSDEDVLLVSKLVEGSETPNEDIFITYKKPDGTWSELIDVGPHINTKGLEFSPFLTHDKKALYFASNGHEGFGESDIFVSYREGDGWDNWSHPLNLGLPINSSAFESSFVISDTNQVYFSSDRESSNTNLYFTKATGKTKMANLGILAGQLFKDGKPLEGKKLKVYDSRSQFLESIETGKSGKVVFRKLVPEDKFEIKLDEAVEENLGGSKLYVVDQDGKLMKRIVFDDEGNPTKPSETGEIVEGFFTQAGSPLLNTAIVVQDENGFAIDTIYTNEVGKFKYSKLNSDKDISFVPRDLSADEEALDLFTIDENGNRVKSYLGNEIAKNNVFGKFSYKNLPLANTAVVVFDEDGIPIDTIYTNSLGMYNYEKLTSDQVYFMLLDQESYNADELLMLQIDKDGNTLKKLAYDKSSGMFTELADGDGDVVELSDTIETSDSSNEEMKGEEKMDEKKEVSTNVEAITLSFAFNEVSLNASNTRKLASVLKALKADESLKVILVGHTDNVGSNEVNARVSQQRAKSTLNYLVAKGISAERVSASSEGETKPVSPNDTVEGRAKNRRVEISFK